jgi:hypothetical protein
VFAFALQKEIGISDLESPGSFQFLKKFLRKIERERNPFTAFLTAEVAVIRVEHPGTAISQ